jgi:hypothetical protein
MISLFSRFWQLTQFWQSLRTKPLSRTQQFTFLLIALAVLAVVVLLYHAQLLHLLLLPMPPGDGCTTHGC